MSTEINLALTTVYVMSGLITLAESLNKLERTCPFVRGVTTRQRIALWLKVMAWVLLALGGAGVAASPFVRLQPPTLPDVAIVLGFASLIIKTRVKEG